MPELPPCYRCVQPQIITRVRTVRRVPAWLLDVIGYLFVDWMVIRWSADRLPSGRWRVTLDLIESDGTVRLMSAFRRTDACQWEPIQAYSWLPLWTTVRLAWFLLWSRPAQPKTLG